MINRLLSIIGCILIVVLLFRNEARMDRIEAKLDDIIVTHDTVNYNKKDLECLTKNIYYEAGIENSTGKYAVGHVTINRLKTGRWGNTVCNVVYAPSQFSWTLKHKLPKPDPVLWEESKEIALKVLDGHGVRGLEHSLFYHADYIRKPKWADDDQKSMSIGRHIFYDRAKNSTLSI